jgi:hypothetical protein
MQVNMDDFFKEQNELFQIDDAKQNMHWEQMKQQLLIAPKPAKSIWKPILIASSLLILLSSTYFIINKSSNKEILKSSKKDNVVINKPEVKNSAIVENKQEQVAMEKQTEEKKVVVDNKKEHTIENKKDLTQALTSNTNIINKEANFYIDLTKEPEINTIDPTKENTITCKQGTTIKIPANSVINELGTIVTEPITIITQEYYRYDNEKENSKKANAGMVKYELYKGEERLQAIDERKIIIKMQSVNGSNTLKYISNNDAIPEKKLLEMNWVSAEKFTADKRPKIEYKITLDKKFDASTFMSQIAFVKENVIMAGDIENNSLLFKNVPIGETVYFMSIGKVDHKYFNCSKKLVTGNTKITEVDFIEISEQMYKKQIDDLGKLGKGQ